VVKEKQSRNKMIKLKKLLELKYIDQADAGRVINDALDELEGSLKKIRKPEQWAEKYHRSLPGVIDMIDRLNKIFGKMK